MCIIHIHQHQHYLCLYLSQVRATCLNLQNFKSSQVRCVITSLNWASGFLRKTVKTPKSATQMLQYATQILPNITITR